MTEDRKRRAYRDLAVYGTLIAFLIVGYLYIGYVDRRADKRNQERARDFCGVIVLIDDRNQQVPPKLPPNATSEQREQYGVQLKFVAAMHAYRVKLGCRAH